MTWDYIPKTYGQALRAVLVESLWSGSLRRQDQRGGPGGQTPARGYGTTLGTVNTYLIPYKCKVGVGTVPITATHRGCRLVHGGTSLLCLPRSRLTTASAWIRSSHISACSESASG